MVCFTGALHKEGDKTAFDVDKCTGCGLCLDICESNALSLARWQRLLVDWLPLRTNRCRACGASYSYPEGQRGAEDLCRICAQTGHHKRLFQVLD